jgi:hypothetical protein
MPDNSDDIGKPPLSVIPQVENQTAKSVAILEREMDATIDAFRQQAKVRWEYYQALKQEGFDDQKALYLTGELFKTG